MALAALLDFAVERGVGRELSNAEKNTPSVIVGRSAA